jgi:hypothetical protein
VDEVGQELQVFSVRHSNVIQKTVLCFPLGCVVNMATLQIRHPSRKFRRSMLFTHWNPPFTQMTNLKERIYAYWQHHSQYAVMIEIQIHPEHRPYDAAGPTFFDE